MIGHAYPVAIIMQVSVLRNQLSNRFQREPDDPRMHSQPMSSGCGNEVKLGSRVRLSAAHTTGITGQGNQSCNHGNVSGVRTCLFLKVGPVGFIWSNFQGMLQS
jgi:hypothetical protein